VVQAKGGKASEALLANADNSTIIRNYPMLIISACLKGPPLATTQMRFGGDLYRYALADALVSKEFSSAPAPQLDAVPRLAHREPEPAPAALGPHAKRSDRRKHEEALRNHEKSTGYHFLSLYGECIVRSNAAGAKAVLLTSPDSPDEAARFGDLRPTLGRCLPEGRTLSFGKVTLRGAIAINYYRLAHAALAGAQKAAP
jgi:hypothetical protein